MPFNQLLNAQQVEASIAGPGDTNRLYLCSGLAQGYFSLTAQSGQWQNASDIWQFGVGPQLDAGQFRRAIAGGCMTLFLISQIVLSGLMVALIVWYRSPARTRRKRRPFA